MRYVLRFSRQRLVDAFFHSVRTALQVAADAAQSFREYWRTDAGRATTFNLALLTAVVSALALAVLPIMFMLLRSGNQRHFWTTLPASARRSASHAVVGAFILYLATGIASVWVVVKQSRRSQRSLANVAMGLRWRIEHAKALPRGRNDFVLVNDGSEMELVELSSIELLTSRTAEDLDELVVNSPLESEVDRQENPFCLEYVSPADSPFSQLPSLDSVR